MRLSLCSTVAGWMPPPEEIVRRTGHSRKLVRSVVRGQRTDIFRIRQTSLEPHLPWLEAQWDAGLRNGAELWRQLRLAGFGGGLRVVTEWATRRRRAEKAENGLGHAPAARTIVRLMTVERNNLTTAQTMTVAAIEERLPDLVEARDVVESFHKMLCSKSKDDLEAWIDRAARSLVASFANGVIRDRAAVQNAITSMWSNGQTEGQMVIPPFLTGPISRIHAAIFSFCLGVMPPMAILGRSLLYVQSQRVA